MAWRLYLIFNNTLYPGNVPRQQILDRLTTQKRKKKKLNRWWVGELARLGESFHDVFIYQTSHCAP